LYNALDALGLHFGVHAMYGGAFSGRFQPPRCVFDQLGDVLLQRIRLFRRNRCVVLQQLSQPRVAFLSGSNSGTVNATVFDPLRHNTWPGGISRSALPASKIIEADRNLPTSFGKNIPWG
jgi:hypothetical protein